MGSSGGIHLHMSDTVDGWSIAKENIEWKQFRGFGRGNVGSKHKDSSQTFQTKKWLEPSPKASAGTT